MALDSSTLAANPVMCNKASDGFWRLWSLVQAPKPAYAFPMSSFIYLVLNIFRLLIDLPATRALSDRQKDIEILLMRHQLFILQRKLPRSPRTAVWEKGFLALLALQFRRCSERTGRTLDEDSLVFKPDTVLPWHRELVRRKWTVQQEKRTGGEADRQTASSSRVGTVYSEAGPREP